jgi:hypothetical protein
MYKGSCSVVAAFNPPLFLPQVEFAANMTLQPSFASRLLQSVPLCFARSGLNLRSRWPLVNRTTLHSPHTVSAKTSTLEAPQAPDWLPS